MLVAFSDIFFYGVTHTIRMRYTIVRMYDPVIICTQYYNSHVILPTVFRYYCGVCSFVLFGRVRDWISVFIQI